jgi:hypothetical protein
VELTVGEQIHHAGVVAQVAQAQRHAGGDTEPVAQRATGDLHPGGVRGHGRHRQARVVGAVGLELLDGHDARLGERGVGRDRVVADGEQEAVALRPLGVLRAEPEQVAEQDGEHVGDAEGLADVALALHLAHVEGVAADAVGGVAEPGDAVGLVRHGGAGGRGAGQ